MTHESDASSYSSPSSEQESEILHEISLPYRLEQVSRLGLPPTAELIEATQAVIIGLQDPTTTEEQLRSAWSEYAGIVEGVVEAVDLDHTNPKAYQRAQISALVDKALLFRTAGDMTRYLEELDHAEVYAFNGNLDDVVSLIGEEIDKVLPGLEMSSEILVIKLRGVISDEMREILRDLIHDGDDYEDIVNNAYGMILEEGGDPEVVLAQLGVLEA